MARPSAPETRGYCGIWGRACTTWRRLAAKTPSPGYLVPKLANPGSFRTDALVGRSPVAIEFFSRLAGEVRKRRNSSDALTRAVPLLNTTQLSGPEIVW